MTGEPPPPTEVTAEDLLSMGFTEEHIDELVKGSAISPSMLVRFGVRPLLDARDAVKKYGRRRQDWEDGRLPAWEVPAVMPFLRDPLLWRTKPRRPFEHRQRDGSIKIAKYVQPKSTGVHVFFGVTLRSTDALHDVSIPLWITEGEKKCMSAESAGLCCLALFGVSQWHLKGQTTLHPAFGHIKLEGRKVYLAFDRDALENHQVRKQEIALGRALEAAGAIVRIVRFPEDAPKLDDFLATHERTELVALIEDADKNGRLPPETEVSEAWKEVLPHLRLDATTNLPVKDVDTVIRIFLHHPEWQGVFGFDARREHQLFLREPPFDEGVVVTKTKIPREIGDSDITRIADWLVREKCLGWKTQPRPVQVEQAVAVLCERTRFDPVQQYLLGLPPWDGKPRLVTMGPTYFGTPDTPYTRAVIAAWMLSAVARARTPGCQVDHLLILEGPQGLKKSSALRILASAEFFSDTLPDISTKDALEHCVGPWIIELAELDHMRKSAATALKAFVSAREPAFRTAYARRTVKHPRRCVFAATTNESTYFADPTGNRRYWPVECTRIDLEVLARDRDQLWAEALARVRAGEPWHITDEGIAALIEEEQSARRQPDPWHDIVLAFVAGRPHVTVGEVLEHLAAEGGEEAGYGTFRPTRTPSRRWQFDQRQANRVAAILRDLRWTRRYVRVHGDRVWRYEAPAPKAKRDEKRGGVATPGGVTGDSSGDGKAPVVPPLSPVSPVSPVDSPNLVETARASSCPPYTPPSSTYCSPNSPNSLRESGDTGDTGDNGEIIGGFPSPLVSPLSPENGGDTGTTPREPLAAAPIDSTSMSVDGDEEADEPWEHLL